jgi:hypothetical protein
MLSSRINSPRHLVHFVTNSEHILYRRGSGSLSDTHLHGENIANGFCTLDPLPSLHQPESWRYAYIIRKVYKYFKLHINLSSRVYICYNQKTHTHARTHTHIWNWFLYFLLFLIAKIYLLVKKSFLSNHVAPGRACIRMLYNIDRSCHGSVWINYIYAMHGNVNRWNGGKKQSRGTYPCGIPQGIIPLSIFTRDKDKYISSLLRVRMLQQREMCSVHVLQWVCMQRAWRTSQHLLNQGSLMRLYCRQLPLT